jgi:NADH dehydrogenase
MPQAALKPGSVVTVFGGTGFIGRQLVQALAARGYVVRIATRHPEKVLYLKTAGTPGQVVAERCTPWESASVSAVIAGSDAVINLIGILFEKDKNTFDRAHVVAPGLIARIATQAGVNHLVHLSAIGANANSDSRYARSKAEGESVVRAGFPDAVILRPSIVFGAGDGFFNRFARMAMWSPFLPLIGGGQTKFQPVYVGDVVRAILAGLDNATTRGQTYELGGPGIYSFQQLMNFMMAQTRTQRYLLTIPYQAAELLARAMEIMPQPMLTRDQVKLLRQDNVVGLRVNTLRSMGIIPTALEAIVPAQLAAYQAGGRFAQTIPA